MRYQVLKRSAREGREVRSVGERLDVGFAISCGIERLTNQELIAVEGKSAYEGALLGLVEGGDGITTDYRTESCRASLSVQRPSPWGISNKNSAKFRHITGRQAFPDLVS